MTHEEARAAYSRKLDGELDKENQARLDAHLAECGECREYCKGLEHSAETLNSLRAVPPVPAGLLEKVKENLPAAPRRPRPFWGFPALVLASAAVVFLVVRDIPREQPQPAPASAPAAVAAPQPLTRPAPPPAPAVAPGQEIHPPEPPPAAINQAVSPVTLPSYKDIFAIERALRAARPAARELVFRGAGGQDPLEEALAAAGLEEIRLTEEIYSLLKSRHKRLPKVQALKAAGKALEQQTGYLAPGGELSEEEKIIIDAENRDRSRLLDYYAPALAAKQDSTAEVVMPGIKKEFAAAQKKAWQ